MKNLNIAIYILAFSLLTSCIEKYDLVMEDSSNNILVVEGKIVGNTVCEFVLQRSFSKNGDYSVSNPNIISHAKLYVICSSGEVFGSEVRNDFHYYVKMGELYPNETYHLRIEIFDEGVYESEPMYPLPTHALKEVTYNMADDGETVQLRITNEDPQEGVYYLWTYDEHWEINTPFETDWTYDPRSYTIVPVQQKTNRGWCSQLYHKVLIGSNFDYGNGALKDYALYTVSNLDNRFNTRYHTTVHQITISEKEYEYYKQMEAQTAQTGGLFTLMPAQLPSNIHNDKGLRVVGYIGIHLNSSDAELYINKEEVGYKSSRLPEILGEEEVKKANSLYDIYRRGFQVYRYNQFLKTSEWTRPWCIDCRDEFWGGASLERPDFWVDK